MEEKFTFMDNNVHPYRAIVNSWFDEMKIGRMMMAKFFDGNLIEHVWGCIRKTCCKYNSGASFVLKTK